MYIVSNFSPSAGTYHIVHSEAKTLGSDILTCDSLFVFFFIFSFSLLFFTVKVLCVMYTVYVFVPSSWALPT